MWTSGRAGERPVDKVRSSPTCANSSFRLSERFYSIIPGVHTLYDYDKGIS
jgi:hypothetical protein